MSVSVYFIFSNYKGYVAKINVILQTNACRIGKDMLYSTLLSWSRAFLEITIPFKHWASQLTGEKTW